MVNDRCRVGDAELRLGKWQTVLADVEMVDAIISDAPYSPTTHEGERGLRLTPDEEREYNATGDTAPRNGINYDPLTQQDVAEFVSSWAPRTRWWAVIFGDDYSFDWWRDAWRAAGWAVFAPVIWRKRNPPPRYSGDGPTCSCEHIMVARPRRRLPKDRIGSRPGDYSALVQMGRNGESLGFVGSKDVEATRQLVTDYTLPGDLVVDPYAGTGTTLRAAMLEGRRAIGAEEVVETYRKASERLRGYGPSLTKHGQTNLFVGAP